MPTGIYKRKPMSEACRMRISQRMKGTIPITAGKNKGKPESLAQRLKISESLRRYKNPAWRGGINKHRQLRHLNTMKYREWRKAIFIRDKFVCCFCGNTGGRLEAHHIEPWVKYKKSRYDINNGITLCKSCHIQLHHGNSQSLLPPL